MSAADDLSVDDSKSQREGSTPTLLLASDSILTPASVGLIHLFPTFYREEQENSINTSGMGEEGRTRGRFTGCCLSFRSCFLPFSQGATLTQVHKPPPPPPPPPRRPSPLPSFAQISTALPPLFFGSNSPPHKAFYCCVDFLALLMY